MTELQGAVNEIRDSMKTEERVKYTFRTKRGLEKVVVLTWDEVQGAEIRVLLNRGWIVIDRKLITVTVGTTGETEEHLGGYGE
jgi:hypothetical protein